MAKETSVRGELMTFSEFNGSRFSLYSKPVFTILADNGLVVQFDLMTYPQSLNPQPLNGVVICCFPL